MRLVTLIAAAATVVNAGTVIWDGRFNNYASAADLDKWSWANQIGTYQWYIHGTGPTTDYVNLSPSYKNPADTSSTQGAKLTISPTALWNSDMWRTELIPQTTANLGTGKLWYHFSVKKTSTNSPNPNYEHQVCFFESHFTELKYGWVNGNANNAPDNRLQWYVGGVSRWAITWNPDVWHNFAYEIDFSAGTVALWHSENAANLVLVGNPVSASTSTNSADWHLGILRLPNRQGGTNDQSPEDWYFSGVYIESGSINTKIGSGSSGGSSSSSSISSTTTRSVGVTSSTSSAPAATSTVAGPTVPKWGQCGGIGWAGATACAAGATCTKVNDYYYQCL